jgi:tRNA pseudouridine38-40 synthase
MNFKLIIQYDGTDFHGWQQQDGRRTVQGELTRVLSLLEGSRVVVHGSGRTDAGVHAEGQVASVQLERPLTPARLRAAINGNLPADVRVMEVEGVGNNFHARYSARGKTYVYRVLRGPVQSPFWTRFAHHESRPLDLDLMRRSAQHLLGEHDWKAFSAAQSDVETRVRTIIEVVVDERREQRARASLLEITVSADGFLRYMVRSFAGALLAVGRGELTEAAFCEAIAGGARPPAIVTAPARGLTLLSVAYD